MADLFKDIIPSITSNTVDALDEEKSYVPFVVNRALSYHKDIVLYANEMNIRNFLDKRMQYDYLRKSVRKVKRPFQKWLKKEKSDYFDAVKEYYDLSDSKVLEILNILTKEELNLILQKVHKGGNIQCHTNLVI